MNTIGLLFALLVASYLSGYLLGAHGHRGGLASGAEWMLAGLAAGPFALGLVPGQAAEAFTPLALVGVGWLALGAGLRFAVVEERRVPLALVVAAVVGTVASAGLVALAVAAVLAWLEPADVPGLFASRDRLVAAAGAGLACAATARRSISWAVERHRARGTITDLLMGVAAADDIAVALGAAALFAWLAGGGTGAPAPWARCGAELGLGLVLGALAALLLRIEWRPTHAVAVLFGASLVGVGLAAAIELSVVGVSFTVGVTLSLASSHAPRLRQLAAGVEAPVLVPVLLLAGARVDLGAARTAWAVAAAAVAARFTVKALAAGLLAWAFPAARRGGAPLGVALAGGGGLGMCVALVVAVVFPGRPGAVALAAAAATTVAGELTVPFALGAALRRAGEAAEEDHAPATPELQP